jgi:hypothetical protein
LFIRWGIMLLLEQASEHDPSTSAFRVAGITDI